MQHLARSAASMLRHVACMGVLSAVAVGVDVVVISSPIPLMAHLGSDTRATLYGQLTTVAVTLLGFVVAAVAILVSFDAQRQIVQELQLGDAFKCLVINMLASIALLAIVTLMSVLGAVSDVARHPAGVYEAFFEVFCFWSIMELVFSGFWFAVATYKVAAYE